jgi:hypothetical protein
VTGEWEDCTFIGYQSSVEKVVHEGIKEIYLAKIRK